MQKSKKGAVLIVVFSTIIVVTIYLSSYVIWTIYDQSNLFRKLKIEQANALARAGLNRATMDLSLDGDSWLDGEINEYPVGVPAPNNPDQFYTLYSGNLTNGNYTVEIDYLQKPKSCTSGCSFFSNRLWLKSTGTTLAGVSMFLQQIVNYCSVKNLTRSLLYTDLQPAINAANDNDNIGITDATLSENVDISRAIHLDIKGCYDPKFVSRSCSSYYSIIQGNLTISGSADVNLSGVTIE